MSNISYEQKKQHKCTEFSDLLLYKAFVLIRTYFQLSIEFNTR